MAELKSKAMSLAGCVLLGRLAWTMQSTGLVCGGRGAPAAVSCLVAWVRMWNSCTVFVPFPSHKGLIPRALAPPFLLWTCLLSAGSKHNSCVLPVYLNAATQRKELVRLQLDTSDHYLFHPTSGTIPSFEWHEVAKTAKGHAISKINKMQRTRSGNRISPNRTAWKTKEVQ